MPLLKVMRAEAIVLLIPEPQHNYVNDSTCIASGAIDLRLICYPAQKLRARQPHACSLTGGGIN